MKKVQTMAEILKTETVRQIEAGESAHSIAKRAGINHGQLSRFLATGTEHRDLRLESAGKLAAALGLTLTASKRRKP